MDSKQRAADETGRSETSGNETSGSAAIGSPQCDRTTAVTRSLLAYGVIAGPFYLVVGLAQALTRDGFDVAHHDLSLLANGPWGWIQVANLVLTGLMTIAAAVGVRRALGHRGSGSWGPRLVGLYGVALVAAGVFVADPMSGFPPGAPDRPADLSWHGLLHLISGALGFIVLVAACFALAGRRLGGGRAWWATYSRITGVIVLVGFAGVATGSSSPVAVLGLWVGVVAGWIWLAMLSIQLYQRAGDDPVTGASSGQRTVI